MCRRGEGSDQASTLLALGGEEAVPEERLARRLRPPGLLNVHLQLLLRDTAQHPGLGDPQQEEPESSGIENILFIKHNFILYIFICREARDQWGLVTRETRGA